MINCSAVSARDTPWRLARAGACSLEGDNLGYFSSLRIQEVCPLLHHSPSLFEVLATMVRGTDGVLFGVGELPLDYVRPIAHFMQRR